MAFHAAHSLKHDDSLPRGRLQYALLHSESTIQVDNFSYISQACVILLTKPRHVEEGTWILSLKFHWDYYIYIFTIYTAYICVYITSIYRRIIGKLNPIAKYPTIFFVYDYHMYGIKLIEKLQITLWLYCIAYIECKFLLTTGYFLFFKFNLALKFKIV